MRGLIAAAVAVVLAVAGGFAIGVALERAGRLDPVAEPDAISVRDSRALAYDCPDGDPVVWLGRADRVVATGRDEEGEWVQLRSPLDPERFVWLPAAEVDLDGPLGGLPLQACAPVAPPSTIPPNPADDRPRPTSTTATTRSAPTSTPGSSSSSSSSSSSTSSSSSSTSSSSTSSSSTSTSSSSTTTATTASTTTTTTEPAGEDP